jgi:hypothetical protein
VWKDYGSSGGGLVGGLLASVKRNFALTGTSRPRFPFLRASMSATIESGETAFAREIEKEDVTRRITSGRVQLAPSIPVPESGSNFGFGPTTAVD